MKYYGAVATDVGIVKKTNQDSVCLKIADTERMGQIVMAVICDGMGGLEKGELASATVIRTLSHWFESELPKRLTSYNWRELTIEWDRMIKEQNYRILEYGKRIKTNLGTTLSALLIIEDRYMIAHVGDSRVYEISNSVKQLTEDQTFVAREIKRGNMTPEQAAADSRRNMLLQCVGASKTVAPDILLGDVKPDTVYMLCSDGFRHVLSKEEIYEQFYPECLSSVEMMNKNSRRLVELVKKRKEKDNITVALIKSVG